MNARRQAMGERANYSSVQSVLSKNDQGKAFVEYVVGKREHAFVITVCAGKIPHVVS